MNVPIRKNNEVHPCLCVQISWSALAFHIHANIVRAGGCSHSCHDKRSMDQLRFRITKSSDPARFANATDLTHPNGLPWHLYPLIRKPESTFIIWNLLIQDGFISDIDSAYRWETHRRLVPTVRPSGELFFFDISRHFAVWNIVSVAKGWKEYRTNPSNSLRPCMLPDNGSRVPIDGQ